MSLFGTKLSFFAASMSLRKEFRGTNKMDDGDEIIQTNPSLIQFATGREIQYLTSRLQDLIRDFLFPPALLFLLYLKSLPNSHYSLAAVCVPYVRMYACSLWKFCTLFILALACLSVGLSACLSGWIKLKMMVVACPNKHTVIKRKLTEEKY